MNRSFLVMALCSALLLAGAAVAQDEPTSYSFAEYYECDQNREGFADLLIEHVFGPVYDEYLEAGDLTRWTWLAHGAGGHWRRLLVYTANDLDTLLETRDKMIEEFEAMGDEGREFTSICPRHDDLIWTRVTGSPAPTSTQSPSPKSYSTYYVCDASRQERADEIVEQLIKPAADALVASGKLDGWFWSAHVIGGPFRRLMGHGGQTHAELIAAVNEYNAAAGQANEALANEFSEICNSHVDYLWNVVLPKPDGN